eukprot:3940503-Rhodomonas_salina.3
MASEESKQEEGQASLMPEMPKVCNISIDYALPCVVQRGRAGSWQGGRRRSEEQGGCGSGGGARVGEEGREGETGGMGMRICVCRLGFAHMCRKGGGEQDGEGSREGPEGAASE